MAQNCTYTGPESGESPGKCSNTSSYISNFEIRDIIATNSNVQQYSSDDEDILVYNDDM
jgi:chitinase